MVTLANISVEFSGGQRPFRAVNDASLEVHKGDVFGIVGTSGAGKSTLLRVINLLQQPVSGRVLIDGVDITRYRGRDLRQVRQTIGMVFQHTCPVKNKRITSIVVT